MRIKGSADNAHCCSCLSQLPGLPAERSHEIWVIGMQGDASAILRNAINVNQRLQMTHYAADFLHAGSRACMPMHGACCGMYAERLIEEADVFVTALLSH